MTLATASATAVPAQDVSLLNIIGFKWLMAGAGHQVHVERMQLDVDYARSCLICGANSKVPALRQVALRLAVEMGIGLPLAP